MLFLDYEPRILIELGHLRELACRVQVKFASGASAEELLQDVEVLQVMFQRIVPMLPGGVSVANLRRHLDFLEYYLNRNQPESCREDIADICRVDIPKVDQALRVAVVEVQQYDSEFADKIGPLLRDQHFDSAVRKAFVMLKERLVRLFGVSSSFDGTELVNAIFGSKGQLMGKIPDAERQAMRDLLAGLYGVFRNHYSHQDVVPRWSEVASVLGMINWVLQRLEGFPTIAATV